MVSKVGKVFRPRPLDAHRPLAVYSCDEISDLDEYAAVNRRVSHLPTGMEKEEEMVCDNWQCTVFSVGAPPCRGDRSAASGRRRALIGRHSHPRHSPGRRLRKAYLFVIDRIFERKRAYLITLVRFTWLSITLVFAMEVYGVYTVVYNRKRPS